MKKCFDKTQHRFIQYLQSKNLAQSSITHYTDCTQKFFAFCQKEAVQVEKKDVLKYLQYLKDRKHYENITRRNSLIALNHYFTFLLKAEQIANNPTALIKIRGTHKRHLYKTYTPEELAQLYDSFYTLFVESYDDSHIKPHQRRQSALCKARNAVILNIMLWQGTTTKEIDTMLLQDIDLKKAILKIRGGKKSNERTLPLKAEQIGLLMNYLQNIRPQLLDYNAEDNGKLFLSTPEVGKKKANSKNLIYVFKPLSKQLKTLDKHFLNFKQIRASVITHWIQTEGLRKAQYYAGHRYISSTEHYLPNEMESLTEDIAQYNPF